MNFQKLQKLSLMVLAGSTVVLFQNCSPSSNYTFDTRSLQSTDGSDYSPVVDGQEPSDDDSIVSIPEMIDGGDKTSDAFCQAMLDGKTVIAYDSIADQQSAEKSYDLYNLGSKLDYERIGSIGNGAGQNLSVVARSIASVSSFSLQNLSLNAQAVGKVSNFSASLVQVASHSISEVSNFAGIFCASVQTIGSLHDLSSKLSVYGRSEGGVKGSIYEIHNMAAMISLHDVDVNSISQGAINARIENGHVGSISHGSGIVYLVNSSVDSIDNFAGEIHLIGNSSVGSQTSSSIKIVKK